MGLNVQNILNKIDVTRLKVPNTSVTYEQALRSELRRFMDILQYEINAFYESYTPVVYERTYNFYESLSADEVVSLSIDGKQLEVRAFFDEGAIHDSIFGYEDKINVAYALNYGYSVSRGWHKDIAYFGYRDGAYFLEHAIEKFESTSRYGIKCRIVLPERYYG